MFRVTDEPLLAKKFAGFSRTKTVAQVLDLIQSLKDQGADDIIVFVGGVIPRQDYDFLYEAGVKGIYGPGTPIPASAKDVLEQIRQAQGL